MAYERRAATIYTSVAIMAAARGPTLPHYAVPLDLPYLYQWVRGSTATEDNHSVIGHTGGTSGRWIRVGGVGAEYQTATQIDDTDSPYTLLATDGILEVDTTTAAVTVVMPAADAHTGRQLWVLDVGYNANTNNITIQRDGTDTIDNVGGNYTMSVDGGGTMFRSRGTANDWWVSG